MLSPEQIAARKGKLTGSRIRPLMIGDEDGVMRLWREMTGQQVEEDLSGVWAVRLGEATEALNLEWFARHNGGRPVSRQGEVIQHAYLSWAAVTLDGWCDQLDCPIEAKHVGGREPLEVIIDRYQPQLQWCMEVTGAERCALSVISGVNPPVIEFIERDVAYADELVRRGAMFMNHVRDRTPPIDLVEPVPPPAVDLVKVYDLGGLDVWKGAAERWLQTHGAVETARDAEKVLKNLMPADARKAHGAGVQITRDRAGRLSLRETTE